jgi:hypothetical protein
MSRRRSGCCGTAWPSRGHSPRWPKKSTCPVPSSSGRSTPPWAPARWRTYDRCDFGRWPCGCRKLGHRMRPGRIRGSGRRASPSAERAYWSFQQVRQKVAGLLGHPLTRWAGGDPGQVHAPGAVLDEEQHLQAAQEHCVDVEEVRGEDRLGLPGQERPPGLPGPLRCGSTPASLRICHTSTALPCIPGQSVRRGCAGSPGRGCPAPSPAPVHGRPARSWAARERGAGRPSAAGPVGRASAARSEARRSGTAG